MLLIITEQWFDCKKAMSDSPSSSHMRMSQFSSFQPFLVRIRGSCRRLSWEREMSLVLFALLIFLTGSYNAKLQSFSGSAVLEIGYCISISGWCNTLETSTLWALTFAHTWQELQVSGVLQLPVIMFIGGLGKRNRGSAFTLWYDLCFNYISHDTYPSLIVSWVWFFS